MSGPLLINKLLILESLNAKEINKFNPNSDPKIGDSDDYLLNTQRIRVFSRANFYHGSNAQVRSRKPHST